MGCGAVALQSELVRFATVGGHVVPDPAATMPGRGAWLHSSAACFEEAVRRRGFARAFKAPVAVPPETLDFIRNTWPRSASTN